MRANPPVALTVAGSDSGGAAGIQADLKTFATHQVFGTSVLTVLTAQNTTGVQEIFAVPTQFVDAQLGAVLADLPVAAVKTGMLATSGTIALLAEWAPRLPARLVVDPVLVDSKGNRLFTPEAERAYLELLFPHAAVITPNTREAAVLTGRPVSTVEEAVAAAERLGASGAGCVVVKGGQLTGRAEAVDVVWRAGEVELLTAPWIDTPNTHGTGCTFAAATTAELARGSEVREALHHAKAYVHRGLVESAGWRLGAGHGPLAWGISQAGTGPVD